MYNFARLISELAEVSICTALLTCIKAFLMSLT